MTIDTESRTEFVSDVLQETISYRRVVLDFEAHAVVGLKIVCFFRLHCRLYEPMQMLQVLLGRA